MGDHFGDERSRLRNFPRLGSEFGKSAAGVAGLAPPLIGLSLSSCELLSGCCAITSSVARVMKAVTPSFQGRSNWDDFQIP